MIRREDDEVESDSEDEDYVPSEHESEEESENGEEPEQLDAKVNPASQKDEKANITNISSNVDSRACKTHVEAIWKEMKNISQVEGARPTQETSLTQPNMTREMNRSTPSSRSPSTITQNKESQEESTHSSPKPVTSRSFEQLVNSLNKKPKLSSLDKTRLDWQTHVQKTNISDELEKNRKNGYLERLDFLRRTDEREFSREQQLKRHKPI